MFGSKDNFADLAAQISSSSAIIAGYLEKNSLPQPTFAVDSPRSLPEVPEVQAARMALIEAAAKIHHLAIGADDYIWQQSLTVSIPCLSFELDPRSTFGLV
jgi:O-methyltransferase domain